MQTQLLNAAGCGILAEGQHKNIWNIGKHGQAQYEAYALPITEFEINDLMNWRAVYRYYWYQQNRAQKSSEWTTLDPTISTGIGFGITRDIFLYPNICF